MPKIFNQNNALELEQVQEVETILFLGAGASQFAGYQTFRRFGELITDPLVRFREKLPELAPETAPLIASINQALITMKRPTTHDNYLWLLTDYHSFCQKFDTHAGLQDRFPRIRDEIHAFDSATMTVINDLKRPLQIYSVDPRTDSDEIVKNLTGASLRSPFNASLPLMSDIRCFQTDFNPEGCKQQILTFLNSNKT